jgi:hypothetical protein
MRNYNWLEPLRSLGPVVGGLIVAMVTGFVALFAMLHGINKSINDIDKKIDGLLNWKGQAEIRLKSLEDWNEQAKGTLKSLQDWNQQARGTLKSLQDWKAETEKRFEEIKGRLEKLGARLEKLEPSNVKLEITSPRNEIKHRDTVKGTWNNVPANVDMWLYIYASGEKKYYFSEITKRQDGTWTTDEEIFGRQREDKNAIYRLGVIICPSNVSIRIRQDEGKGNYGLPSGSTKVGEEIEVIRK